MPTDGIDHLERAEQELGEICAAYPDAALDHPWGENVYKVHGKVFAFLNIYRDALYVTLKLPASQGVALAEPFAEAARYHLGQAGWVTARFEGDMSVPVDVLAVWIDESYRSIAPRKLVAKLDAAGALP